MAYRSFESSISCVIVYECSDSQILPTSADHDKAPVSRCSWFGGTPDTRAADYKPVPSGMAELRMEINEALTDY
jgi:hypothetical protein